MDEFLNLRVQQVAFQYLETAAKVHIPKELLINCSLSVEEVVEHCCEKLVIELRKKLLANKVQQVEETVSYPASWWQHFKEQYFPVWLKKKFPVRKRKVVVRLERWEGYPLCRRVFPEMGPPYYYVFTYREENDE